MSSNNPRVMCKVEQCTHWMPDNQCMAANIAIYNDEEAATSKTSQDTQCKSFHAGKGITDYVGALHNANIGDTIKAAFTDNVQASPSVECYVNNCKFWERSNYCNSPSIEVHGSNAAKTSDTGCDTFAPR